MVPDWRRRNIAKEYSMTATNLIGEPEIVLTDGTVWHEGDEMSHDTEGGMISILSLPEYQIDEEHLGWCVEHGWVTATRYLLELVEDWVSRCFGPDSGMGTFGEPPSDPPHTYESHARHGVYWRGAVEACLESVVLSAEQREIRSLLCTHAERVGFRGEESC